MSDDISQTVAAGQLRAFVERIERIEAEIKDLNDDKSEIYKELRGAGFDVKGVRQCVAARKLDSAEREERSAIFDLYWAALTGEDRARARAHRNIEESPAPQFSAAPGGEPSIPSSDAGVGKNGGRASALPERAAAEAGLRATKSEQATTISPGTAHDTHERPSHSAEASPEAGPQAEASLAGTGTGTLAGHEGRSEGEAASAGLPTHSENGLAGPALTQGSSLPANTKPAPTFNVDANVPAFLKSEPVQELNPRCQKPDTCKWARSTISCSACANAWAKSRVAA